MTTASEPVLSQSRRVTDSVRFRGHPMVTSRHPTTIEVTTEEHLTLNGDCIIGVAASKGCAQLSDGVKDGLRRKDSKVTIRVLVGGLAFQVNARGDPRLSLSHPRDMVIRKSEFISDRTLTVGADASARSIPREMVLLLKDPSTTGRLEIEVD